MFPTEPSNGKEFMNRPIRRKDRQLSESEALEIMQKGEFGVLSMSTDKNEGYGVPINYAMVNNEIYFHCAVEGSKLDFIRKNNKVSFCVVGNTKVMPEKFGTIYESSIASGTISEVDGDEKREALMKLIEKYSGDYVKEGIEYINKQYDRVKILKLKVEGIRGKGRKQ